MLEFFESWLRSVFRPLLSVLLLVCAPRIHFAQETPSTTKSTDSSPEATLTKDDASKTIGKTAADSTLPAPTIRYLPNKNGKLIEFRSGQTFEEFLDFVKENQNKSIMPLAASITSFEISGAVDDDRATLKVVFTVRLLNADQWVRIPLYFNEALLLKPTTYIGDGEDAPAEKDPEKGYVWWFRGRGQHRLEMEFSVPLKKQLPSRSLLISLPPSPVSRIQLGLPYPSVNAKILPKQTVMEVKPSVDGKSTIEAIGLGTRLDLTWQPNSDLRQNEVSLESQTTIWVQIESDHALVRADQQIKSFQGLFDRLEVRLPTGADLVKLDDSDKQTYKVDPENRQRVTVSLKEKVSSAQLSWTVRLDLKMRSLIIDGFSVEGARKQVGKIGLSIAEGLRLSERRDPNLVGINAGEFPAAMGPVVRAYQFLNQPFKLSATFDELKPSFRVERRMLLTASAQTLTLDGEFEFHVDRDRLGEVGFAWPNFKTEGWTIEALDEPRAVESGVVESFSIDDQGQILARLVKPRSGSFSVHIRANRHLKAGDDVLISLPRPKLASRLSPTNLVLVNAENVDTDLTARGETVFRILPLNSQDLLSLPESARELKSTRFRVETDEQTFALRVTPQKQRVRTESMTEAKWQEQLFRITQHLYFDVSYERMSQVRVVVPLEIDLKRVQFSYNNGVELIPELIPPPVGTVRQILLKLKESQLGRFEIQAKYSIPFVKDSLDADRRVGLPLLGCADTPFFRTRVSLAQSDWFDAEPVSLETWQPQLNTQEALEWMSEGQQMELPLKLARSTHSNETGSVSRALVKLFLDGNGDGTVRAQIRMMTRATSLPVLLPASSRLPTFYWDQKKLSAKEDGESSSESHRYTVVLPEKQEGSASVEHLLTIDYSDHFGPAMGWSDGLELRSPQLLSCSWDQVIWQVILPAGQHLLTNPVSASPMFRWQRIGLFWGRVSDPSSAFLEQWVTSGVMELPPLPNTLTSEKNGNLYSFSQFNSPKPLVFQSLSSPMVLLFGAGFSLAVGFVILRISVLRHVLTLLLLALIIAVVGLWYAAPLELLLQPMIVGVLFPATAVFLEGWIRRRYDTSAISFDGQGEFPPMHSFGSNHYVLGQIDPNETTLHRPGTRESDPSVPIETGSGVS